MFSRKLHFFHGLRSSSRQYENFFVFDALELLEKMYNRLRIYDVDTNCERQWLFELPDVLLREHPATALIRDRMYIFGGGRYNAKGEIYQQVTDEVESISIKEIIDADPFDPLSWDSIRPMQVARGRFAAAVVQDVIYLVGGCDNNNRPMSSCESYDPNLGSGSAQTEVPDMNTSRFGHAVVSRNNVLYAIGGKTHNDCPLFTCEMYDKRTGSWQELACMATSRTDVAATVLHGEIYAMGGEDHIAETRAHIHTEMSVEKYDVRRNSWSWVKHMLAPRQGSCACAVNNKIYVVGGYERSSSTIGTSIEIYDPMEDRWELKLKEDSFYAPVVVRY